MSAEDPEHAVIHGPDGTVHHWTRHADWLAARGYLRPAGPESDPAREVFYSSERRVNARRDDAPDGLVLYEKQALGIGRRAVRATRRACGKRGSLLLREWHLLLAARTAGLQVPRPWAVGEEGPERAPRRGFLLVEELGGEALSELVYADLPTGRRRQVAEAVGRAAAALHDAGFQFPEMTAKHVFVDAAGQEPLVGFIDLASAALGRRPAPGARARDLGALAASLPRTRVSRPLRLVALRAYLRASPVAWSRRDAWRATTRQVTSRQRLRRYRGYGAVQRSLEWRPARPRRGLLCLAGAQEPVLAWLAGHRPEACPPGWSHQPDLVILRGPVPEVRTRFNGQLLLRSFGVSGARPLALQAPDTGDALALFEEPAAAPAGSLADPANADALEDLLLRVLEAGVVPLPGFLEHVHAGRDGSCCLDLQAPWTLPRRLGHRHARRGLITLVRSLRSLPWPAAVRRRLARTLRSRGPGLALHRG